MPIRSSVGLKGVNNPGDVMFVQILLNDWRVRNSLAEITVDGIIGPETNGAIELFQDMATASRDDRVDPDGPTIRALEAAHLDGVLSGKFSDYVRALRSIRMRRNPATTDLIFRAYLVKLRQGLG
jgi:hypothetical protein